MTTDTTCKVKLLNRTYEIKCPAGEEAHLKLAAKKLNNKMLENKAQAKLLDDFQVLLLSALGIAHELVLCKNEQEQQRNQMSQFISSIESKINTMANIDTSSSKAD